jgi:hypothetical protein
MGRGNGVPARSARSTYKGEGRTVRPQKGRMGRKIRHRGWGGGGDGEEVRLNHLIINVVEVTRVWI